MSSTSFVQYVRCDICRLNHQKTKSHVYSKRHQEILKNALKKFLKKIIEAKKYLTTPNVEAVNWEVGARFWCYCCAEEVEKHKQMSIFTLRSAGLLHHLAGTSHHEKTKTFWKKYHPKANKMDDFVLAKDLVIKFDALCPSAVERVEVAQVARRSMEASKLLRQDQLRQHLVLNYRRHHMSEQLTAASHPHHMGAPLAEQSPMRTVAAKAQGLTVVTPKAYDTNIGNIHTGNLPPWLRTDLDQDLSPPGNVIGPTQEDLKKHMELERKRKLPADRVGAKFNHGVETSATWLPSFGRVWSNNRRTHGRDHFMKELKKRPRVENSGLPSLNHHFSSTRDYIKSPTYVPKSESIGTSAPTGVYQKKRTSPDGQLGRFDDPTICQVTPDCQTHSNRFNVDQASQNSWSPASSQNYSNTPTAHVPSRGQYYHNEHSSRGMGCGRVDNQATTPHHHGYQRRRGAKSCVPNVPRIAISNSLLTG